MTIRLPAAIFVLVFVPVLPPRRYFASKAPWRCKLRRRYFVGRPSRFPFGFSGSFYFCQSCAVYGGFLNYKPMSACRLLCRCASGASFFTFLAAFFECGFGVWCGASVSIVLQQVPVRFQTVSALVLSLACGTRSNLFFCVFSVARTAEVF